MEDIIKEGFKMKQFIKYAAVGLAGYFIGFYEMKYEVVKAIANGYIEAEKSEENVKEEEAQ
jgi:hypothetical protein